MWISRKVELKGIQGILWRIALQTRVSRNRNRNDMRLQRRGRLGCCSRRWQWARRDVHRTSRSRRMRSPEWCIGLIPRAIRTSSLCATVRQYISYVPHVYLLCTSCVHFQSSKYLWWSLDGVGFVDGAFGRKGSSHRVNYFTVSSKIRHTSEKSKHENSTFQNYWFAYR